MNTKLHAVTDGVGRPILLHLTEGQTSDYRGADSLIDSLPKTGMLIADRGYDSDALREVLKNRDIVPCIPGRKNRKTTIVYDTAIYKQRNRIERMFGRLKDWRRVATRYDRCAHTFKSAIALAATIIFWL